MSESRFEIIDVPVCDLMKDGSGAEVWLERSDGPAIKLKVSKKGLAHAAAKFGYAAARLASQGATGQTVGLPAAAAKALAHQGSDQITIAVLLVDGYLLQIQLSEGSALALARELVSEIQSLSPESDKPLQ